MNICPTGVKNISTLNHGIQNGSRFANWDETWAIISKGNSIRMNFNRLMKIDSQLKELFGIGNHT